ncbi:SAM dependent methyltransferase [Pseudomonas aeruginosa]|nr:SAM dependent methyltransferase [Pseudomonas aeruginosa]
MMKDLRESTADDGTYLMVELNLSQELHENMNLFGRVMYPQSTLYCMTCSLSHGGEGLGAFHGRGPRAADGRGRRLQSLPQGAFGVAAAAGAVRTATLTALSGTAGTATVG